ncbi:hypothetical protein [Salmon gill poxvirus]
MDIPTILREDPYVTGTRDIPDVKPDQVRPYHCQGTTPPGSNLKESEFVQTPKERWTAGENSMTLQHPSEQEFLVIAYNQQRISSCHGTRLQDNIFRTVIEVGGHVSFHTCLVTRHDPVMTMINCRNETVLCVHLTGCEMQKFPTTCGDMYYHHEHVPSPREYDNDNDMKEVVLRHVRYEQEKQEWIKSMTGYSDLHDIMLYTEREPVHDRDNTKWVIHASERERKKIVRNSLRTAQTRRHFEDAMFSPDLDSVVFNCQNTAYKRCWKPEPFIEGTAHADNVVLRWSDLCEPITWHLNSSSGPSEHLVHQLKASYEMMKNSIVGVLDDLDFLTVFGHQTSFLQTVNSGGFQKNEVDDLSQIKNLRISSVRKNRPFQKPDQTWTEPWRESWRDQKREPCRDQQRDQKREPWRDQQWRNQQREPRRNQQWRDQKREHWRDTKARV